MFKQPTNQILLNRSFSLVFYNCSICLLKKIRVWGQAQVCTLSNYCVHLFMSRDCSYQLVCIPYFENCYNFISIKYIFLILIGQQPVIRRWRIVAGKVTLNGHFHATIQLINIYFYLFSFFLGITGMLGGFFLGGGVYFLIRFCLKY